MHIPDGYLSPSTCACLYGACSPFWFRALQKVRNYRQARALPLLSLFAAFSFVLMMFNLPLPGGTTGHAVGIGIAAVVLGPSLSVIAISMALLIQALFFGDGGITSYGANCFNMAVVGPYVASAVYKLVAWGEAADATRRIWAAGAAGYVAVNAAALCAAVEFGIQPSLFHDASGAPLYAPYPLSVAVPAMIIGHLTIAGVAEFVVSAGLVAYVQRARPELLSTGLLERRLTPLWTVLAVLLLATPLGIIAVGTAWGEWKVPDFNDGSARAQMAAASGQAPPAGVPRGLQQFSGIWKAPVGDYSPGFIRSRSLGYVVSAIGGVAILVFGFNLLLSALRRRRTGMAERTSRALIETVDQTLFAEQCWQRAGFLQRTHPCVKVLGTGVLIVAAAAASSLSALATMLLLATLASRLSRVPVFPALARVWLGVLLFTGAVALPALFLTPGHLLFSAPFGISLTIEGLRGAFFLLLRAATISTLCAAVVLTTTPSRVLHALRWLRMPAILVASAGMTYRYIFLLMQSARGLLEGRSVRTIGKMGSAERRKLTTLSLGALFDKVFGLSGDVHDAMVARGFRGEIYVIDESPLRASDWLQVGLVCFTAISVLWWTR